MVDVVKVAVDKAAFHFDKLYDYLPPKPGQSSALVGCRVLVPFGRGNQKRQGVVLGFGERERESFLKPVSRVIDERPVLTSEMLRLMRALKESTFCTWFDALRCVLPGGLGYEIRPRYTALRDPYAEEAMNLSGDESRLYTYIKNRKDGVQEQKIKADLGFADPKSLLEKLQGLGLIAKLEDVHRRVLDETVTMVRLTGEEPPPDKKLTQKQQAVAEFLEEVGSATLKEIGYFTGVTRAVTDRLRDAGVVEYLECEVYRSPQEPATSEEPLAITLSDYQQKAYNQLYADYRSGRYTTALLYGVTGSGKTSVFLKLTKQVIADGKSVIVMVPEISLTPQTVEYFHRCFGKNVAVMHSALSMGQRLDEWKRIRRGEVQVVVGTRSAVFAPLEHIGLIIIDEEQEHTYKSESSPRFHARDVAKVRCNYHGAMLLLSSATPSVESFYFAKTGRYHLVSMRRRYAAAKLPETYIVDMRMGAMEGNTSIYSAAVLDALKKTLQKGEQAILLLNRRGYHTSVRCPSCGHVWKCPHCSISMTYHRMNGRLMCHYCGYSEEVPRVCPECGFDHLSFVGVGTQQAEEQLREILPGARVLRMDMDTTMSKFSYQKNFDAFRRGEYDVMIGTQMVAKGLNFPKVTMVAVLSIDQALYSTDFRAYERAFGLMTQVVGRCGRNDLPGKAYIQTYTPENPVIEVAAAQDYDRFFEDEILNRKVMLYPPFCSICSVGFSGERESQVIRAAGLFVERMREKVTREYASLPIKVLGPTGFGILKVSNKYRYRVIIKCRNDDNFRRMMGELLTELGKQKEFSDVSLFADLYFDSNQ
ncbi:replication restart helicase PriA [Zongyangia hominis]|uniref:replication restart helicase PriA n=1 Tax=Zongyangia hominis TaxID=2763677 RepID=UPI0021CD09F7|nr:primosomal protein N' [Zongyangia hominis]